MSVEQVRASVGQDGIDIAVKALKDIAADEIADDDTRVRAASQLLSYGLASTDAIGNAQVA